MASGAQRTQAELPDLTELAAPDRRARSTQSQDEAEDDGSAEAADGATGDAEAWPEGADPVAPVDADLAADGLIADGAPEAIADGGDAFGSDTRTAEEIAVFEQPPAGFDPLLFQIEDIEPLVTDRRPARLARIEPYDPVGIKIGTFILFPEAELGGFYTDNALSSASAVSDVATDLRGSARLVSNWSRHALELRGSLAAQAYDEYGSEDTNVRDAEVRGRIDFTRRTNLQAGATYGVSQESRSGIDANRSGPRADIVSESAAIAVNHRFNRLSLQLRGSVSSSEFSETELASNRDRDTLQTEQAVRARWEFKPTLSPFAEVGLNQTETGAVAASDGISRDSSGERYRVGLDFGSTGQFLRGEISAGYGRQEPDDARLKTSHAFLFDANLAWRPTEITSFLLSARTDLSLSTGAFTSGAIAHQIGLEARHVLRRYVIASAGISYTDFDYVGSALEEGAATVFVGAEYFASPELVLFTRYQHLGFSSNQAGGDYDENTLRAGVRVRR